MITRDVIRRSLSAHAPPAEPGAEARAILGDAAMASLFPGPLVPAAVLVPLVERLDGLSILLTRRTTELPLHPGQISFPGGRVDPGDSGALATALRETEEELGIGASAVEIAGYLPVHPVVTGFAVTPVVGFLAPAVTLRPNPREVAEAFEVPLQFAMDPNNSRRGVRQVGAVTVPAWELTFEGHRIWGATANILLSLIDKLYQYKSL